MIINIMSGGGKYSGRVPVSTVNVNYPVGSVCTCTNLDSGLRLIAPDTNGTFSFLIPTKGTWRVMSTNNLYSTAEKTIQIDSLTGVHDITLEYFSVIVNVNYPVGSVCTCTNGSITLYAPDKSGTAMFDIPIAGKWTVISDNSESIYSHKEQTIQADTTGTVHNITLKYFAATITVSIPPHSLCTCDSEELNYRYENSEDIKVTQVFTVPRVGEWTVTVTNGIETKYRRAEITSDEQNVYIVLNYDQYFYSNNNQYTDITGGYSLGANQGNASISYPDGNMQVSVSAYSSEIASWDAWAVTNNKVEIIGYTLTCVGSTSRYVRWGISDNKDDMSFVASTTTFGDLDVSDYIGGTYYIKLLTSAGSDWGRSTMTINSVLNH